MYSALRGFGIVILLACFFLVGCAADDEDWFEDEIVVEMSTPPIYEEEDTQFYFNRVVESPVEFLPFMVAGGPFSRLTGLPLDEELLYRRPLAMVINNSARAWPHSGLVAADIVYEVLAEGDVTRILAVFQSYIPEKIGPIRSARDYFVDFALNHGALFVHHGGSPGGYSRIRALGVTNIDGIAHEGSVFWRDRSYPYWAANSGTRPLEHSSYTGVERLFNHIYNRGIRDYWREDPDVFGFDFNHSHPVAVLDAGSVGQAYIVTVPFSHNYFRRFVFDHESGLYLVENRHGAHIDADTQEQIATSNILVQFANKRVIDAVGRRAVDTIGSGAGYLIYGGRYQLVRWAKDSHDDPMRWYFDDGTPLTLVPGRVWICVFQSNGEVVFE